MRQSEVLQPRPLISTSQWRCKKCLNWSSLWEGLQMEMLGLGMQICRWAWLAQSGQPESVTVPVSGELQCSDCAPSLVWGEQLLPMRPAKQSLVVACGQAWKINTGFWFGVGLLKDLTGNQEIRILRPVLPAIHWVRSAFLFGPLFPHLSK